MSGWTTITFRGLYSKRYEYSEYDEKDPYQANCDLIVSLENDNRVSSLGYWNSHVYAKLATERYDWDTAEQILVDAQEMTYDAVVIGANDTSDTGVAKYYPVYNEWNGDADHPTHTYEETQSKDGTNVGAIAASVMTARHGIVAQETLQYRATGGYDNGVMDYHREKGRDKF